MSHRNMAHFFMESFNLKIDNINTNGSHEFSISWRNSRHSYENSMNIRK